MQIDLPVWSSVDIPAALLTATAMLAIFRFNVPMLATLAGSALVGVAWFAIR